MTNRKLAGVDPDTVGLEMIRLHSSCRRTSIADIYLRPVAPEDSALSALMQRERDANLPSSITAAIEAVMIWRRLIATALVVLFGLFETIPFGVLTLGARMNAATS